MADVDPFAGIPTEGEMGPLGGFNYDEGETAVAVADPEEGHLQGDDGIGEQIEQLPEGLAIDGVSGEVVQLPDMTNAIEVPGTVEQTVDPSDPLPAGGGELPSTTTPDAAPSESTGSAAPAAAQSDASPPASTGAGRKRRKAAAAAPAEKPATPVARSSAKDRKFLFFAEGQLDSGAPFWYVAHEISAPTKATAIRRLYSQLGNPTEFKFRVTPESRWNERSVEVQTVQMSRLVIH